MSLRAACLCAGFAAILSLGLSAQSTPTPTVAWLDRYAAGQFDAVVAELEVQNDFGQILKELKAHTDTWVSAGGPADRGRRELVAATFALEAARVDEWREWKWIQKPPESTTPLPTLYWMPPPLLIEWACERWSKNGGPSAAERTWQLAALAVAQRAEDTQFLIGFTQLLGGAPAAPGAPLNLPPQLRNARARIARRGMEVSNVQDEIGHLNHVMDRFPAEPRFVLGQAIARERDFPDDASQIYPMLADDPAVGGEALMRLGGIQVRQGRAANALESLDRAERLTRDAYVLYLARVFKGMALQRLTRDADAIGAYRMALAARPGGESASVRLAELLFASGKRGEAQAVMAAVLAADPSAKDPFVEIVHADDRFWPRLIRQLRAEIHP